MPQPTMTILTVTPQQASWDATVNTNFQALRAWLEDGPLPIHDDDALPAAASWDQSIMMHEISPGVWRFVRSDGTDWQTIAWAETSVSTLGLTASGTYVQAELQSLADKVDELIQALRDGFALVT